jgi:hypothetical protein
MALKLLRLLLFVNGLTMALAAPAVLLPRDWMAAIYAWLGLGRMPDGPMFVYLARSLSMLYAVMGVISLILSIDPSRHRPLVIALGLGLAALGCMVIGMGASGELPLWHWALPEGLLALACGLAILLSARRARPAKTDAERGEEPCHKGHEG